MFSFRMIKRQLAMQNAPFIRKEDVKILNLQDVQCIKAKLVKIKLTSFKPARKFHESWKKCTVEPSLSCISIYAIII